MPADIEQWLEGLGLGMYAGVFAENDVDFRSLPHLDRDDLKELGVSLGHRKVILAAIKAMDDPRKTEEAASPRSSPAGSVTAVTGEAERRQLTVMFCDLVDSTALSTKIDPEDLRDVITSFQDACRAAIARYDGFIAKFMGDGVLVYFGYPRAHENDAERAIRAGLDIVGSMTALNSIVGEARGVALAVRIGVATGPVVVGDLVGEGAAEEAAVVGETPNLAARLQGIAQPNQVVISPATRRIVGDLFTLEDLGLHELKGISNPVQASRVTGAADIEGRYEIRRLSASSPLVGRQEELGLLLRAWESARKGRGQVVLILGEAGVGKSRLLEALREPLVEGDYVWVSIRCSPYHASSTLYPVIEHFKRAMNWEIEDDDQLRLEKLERALRTQSTPLEDAVPLFAELMSLPLPPDKYAWPAMTPQEKREATLDAITGWLLELADSKPVLQVWEDLHWADPTTLELLGLYIEQSPTVPMLNVVTHRPDFVPPWPMRSHMTPITLNRLERPDVEAFVSNLTDSKPLPREVLEHIVSKADGIPLFVEELTKTIIESAVLREEPDRYMLDGPLAEMQIPSTLQDSLMARLDRVPTLREMAQLGAVLGREFAYEMLHRLSPVEEPALQEGLGQLVEGEVLYQRGRGQRARYMFKHALVQDAAYQSLLKRTRKYYHQQVAELLESRYPEIVQNQPEVVAQHYARAENQAKAVEYLVRFADKVAGIYAHAEAVAALEEALAHANRLPGETQDRNVLEIILRLAESLHFLGRRQQLVDRLQQEQQRLDRLEDPALAGKYYFWLGFAHSFLGHRAEADEALHRSLEAAALSGDEAISGRVHRALAMECSFSGRPLEEAVDHGRQAVAMLERTTDRFWLAQALFTLSYVSYYTGNFASSLDAATRLDALGVTTGSRRARANAAMMAGLNCATRGDLAEGIEAEQRALALSPDNFEKAWILACLGKAHLEAGDAAQAVPVLEQAVELADQVRSLQLRCWFRTMLGNAYAAVGDCEKAMDVAREALETSTDIKFLLGVGLSKQVLGRIACAQGMVAQANRNFDEASQTLRAIGAEFELARTHIDLATLAHGDGDIEVAAHQLSLAHALFTALQVPVYVARTKQLIRQFGLPDLA